MTITDAGWVIGGVSLPAMILALVQFLKTQLSLSGTAVRWLSFFLGLFFAMLLLSAQYFGGLFGTIVTWTIVSLNFALSGLAASSVYDAIRQAAGRGG